MRQKHPNFLLIAGNARNVGKSNLVIAIIQKYSQLYPVIGLKVSAVYPGDEPYHGYHTDQPPFTWSLFQETSPETSKDTSKFLKAGATSVWFLRARDEFLAEGFSALLKRIEPNSLVVCESRSLIKLVEPGSFILIEKHFDGFPVKDVTSLIPLADLRIITGAGKYSTEEVLAFIETDGKRWHVSSRNRLIYP